LGRRYGFQQRDNFGGIRFHPHVGQSKGRELRAPCRGSYRSSEERYQAFIHSGWQSGGLIFAKPSLTYELVRYLPEHEQADQYFSIYHLLGLDGRNAYARDAREAITVAAMLRHAVNNLLRREGLSPDRISDLMGHGQKGNQIFCLPLPSIGHRHADGMIRRVMLKALDPDTLALLDWGLDGCELELQNRPVAMLSRIQASDGVADQFIGVSSVWETTIPVVLPGYDHVKRKKAKTEKLILRALNQSGFALSNIESFWFQRLPWHQQGHCAGVYKTAQYMRYPQYHLRVKFVKALRGPIVLGAGRYLGLGLMSRVWDSEMAEAA
jgi:CRISPR-associated protein Csb2